MLKDAIKAYLDEYFKVWEEERESLPTVSYEEEEQYFLAGSLEELFAKLTVDRESIR